MAHDAAKSAEGSDALTVPVVVVDPRTGLPRTADEDFGSIDQLLASTDTGWDVEAQVRTLQQAAATTRGTSERSSESARPPSVGTPTRPSKGPPPLPRRALARPAPPTPPSARPALPPAGRPVGDALSPEALVDLLRGRVAVLEARGDKVGLSRAHVELAIVQETLLGDDARARSHAEAAIRANPTAAAAHGLLRRTKHARNALSAMVEHIEQELLATGEERDRVELLVEKARLLDAMGGRGREVRAAWEQALAHAPRHPAALKGLEAELVARALAGGAPSDWEALASHLGRMAEACVEEPELAAWLHVERARILERKLDHVEAARGALERAVELDPGIGPARDSLVRHVGTHSDWTMLVRLLEEQGQIDGNSARAARYELDAATISALRLGERGRACTLLERAASRAPTDAAVDRRVLDELIRLSELEGLWEEAARARRARLRFVTDPAVMAHELRALAATAERTGDLDTATADVQRALAIDATDPALVETLDRLLASTDKHEARIAAWLQESARTEDAGRRAKALVRAARICDEAGRRGDAIRHLRSAWVSAPGDAEVLDGLARLLSPSLSEPVDAGARSLVELYAHAADHATDPGRKVAYLERVALLWEELLGDPARAARYYELVLALDPDRRSAMLGLSRTAARIGDAKALAHALLEEARVSADRGSELDLRTRAAAVLSAADPARAIALVRDVLEQDAKNAPARALETRLYEEAGRWELAAKSLRARIDAAGTTRERVSLWLALAQLQHVRLRSPGDAMASLERARGLDPSHPVAPEEIVRVLEDNGDPRVLRDAVERLASSALTPEERARQLARAAEIDELRLADDASAARTYQRALAETPDDDRLSERLARVNGRRARRRPAGELAELASLFARRIERATSPSDKRAMTFDLAWLLVESGQEPMRAVSLLETVLDEQEDHVAALRTLEWLRRRAAVDVGSLARVLAREAASLKDTCARLGALWNLAFLEEWVLPGGQPSNTYRTILDLDPADPAALAAIFRCDFPDARRGEPRARASVFASLRALSQSAPNVETRVAHDLRLALLLERAATEEPNDSQANGEWEHEAIGRYKAALELDALSVTAATGLARLAARLGDPESSFAAAVSMAEVSDEGRTRARYLIEAAEVLLSASDEGPPGSPPERRKRAMTLLERALEADADSIPAGARLATVLLEEKQGERLVSAFRAALASAKSAEAIVMFGSEVARVARDELHDLPIAIDAMRRVRLAAPEHIPSLLTLAELCIAQRVWPEAVDSLEAVGAKSREVVPRLTALFALASIYEKVLARPADVDRVLRSALALDPSNVRALRALIRRLAAEPTGADESVARSQRREIASLLTKLAEVETDVDQKTSILIELSEVQHRLGDVRAAERALIEASAVSPASNTRAFSRLTALFRRGDGVDAPGLAQALTALITLGERSGRVDARWLATLGQVEVGPLARLREGAAHMDRAVELDPSLHDVRFDLARVYKRLGRHDEAARALVSMLTPLAHPLLSLPDPLAALSLLEESLAGSRRADDAMVVADLRFIGASAGDARRTSPRARRAPALDASTPVLDRTTLVTHVLPSEGRHVLLEVAAAVAGVESRVLRSDLSELGISARDRVASRGGNPARLLLDRMARQFGVGDVELVVAKTATRLRVLTQDVPWVVVSPSFIDRPEMVQLAALTRAVARIAYGVPWVGELTPTQVEAFLVAAARQVAPGYPGADAKAVAHYEGLLGRALPRRQRKLLEELAPHMNSAAARPLAIAEFVEALARAELRAAFLITGDLLAVIDETSTRDAVVQRAVEAPGPKSLGIVLEHPLVGDVVRYSLTPEATGLRKRLGTLWTR